MSSLIKIFFTTSFAILAACSAEESTVGSVQSAAENPAAEDLEVLTAEIGSFGIDLSHQDPDTRAGDDFFRFTNGQWLDTYELPADRSNYGSFSVLGDRSD